MRLHLLVFMIFWAINMIEWEWIIGGNWSCMSKSFGEHSHSCSEECSGMNQCDHRIIQDEKCKQQQTPEAECLD